MHLEDLLFLNKEDKRTCNPVFLIEFVNNGLLLHNIRFSIELNSLHIHIYFCIVCSNNHY
jgi:hypothetical protein